MALATAVSWSLPMRERELKPVAVVHKRGASGSLPMRERELKRKIKQSSANGSTSLPMRERELKRAWRAGGPRPAQVAPHAGA